MIDITSNVEERVSLILSGVKNGFPRAMKTAINKTTPEVRKEAASKVVETYAIAKKNYNRYSKVRVQKATNTNLVGSISYAGGVIPLSKFKIRPGVPWTRSGRRPSIHKAGVLKSGGLKGIPGVFTAQMQSGHIGVFERVSKKSLPIKQLYGPSVTQMVGGDKVEPEIRTRAEEILDKTLEEQISKILKGGRL